MLDLVADTARQTIRRFRDDLALGRRAPEALCRQLCARVRYWPLDELDAIVDLLLQARCSCRCAFLFGIIFAAARALISPCGRLRQAAGSLNVTQEPRELASVLETLCHPFVLAAIKLARDGAARLCRLLADVLRQADNRFSAYAGESCCRSCCNS